MGDIFTNLKRTFNSGNILAKLIYINVGLFVIIRLASVILMLFNLGGFPFLQYLHMLEPFKTGSGSRIHIRYG